MSELHGLHPQRPLPAGPTGAGGGAHCLPTGCRSAPDLSAGLTCGYSDPGSPRWPSGAGCKKLCQCEFLRCALGRRAPPLSRERREQGVPELEAPPRAGWPRPTLTPSAGPAAPPRLGARPSWERARPAGWAGRGSAGGRRARQPDSITRAASVPELSLRAHRVQFLHTEPHCHPEMGAVASQAGSRGAVT